MAITKVSDLDSLFNLIYEDAIFVAREMNLMTNMVRHFNAKGYMQRKGTIRPQITAVEKAEGDDFQTPTTFGKSLKYTLTPTMKMSQVLITDEDIDTDQDGARQDAAQELGASIATKIDVDLVTLFISLTTGKASAGAALTISNVAAALAVLRVAKAPNPFMVVLHPYGYVKGWLDKIEKFFSSKTLALGGVTC